MSGEQGPGPGTDADRDGPSDAKGDAAREAGASDGDGDGHGDDDGDTGADIVATGRTTDEPRGREGRDADPVELGVELLRKFEGSELSVAAAVDRIETISTDPAITRAILDRAERRGVIEREKGLLRTRGGGFVRYESEVISKKGEFTCRRCGTGLGTGYFLKLEAGEHGPFGSSCIRKVTGRERE